MFSIIVAYDENQAIGKDNQLLWHFSEDLGFFKQTTLNHTIVMGRKTFESIGKPLPKRKTIVLSREDMRIEGVEVTSFEDLKERYIDTSEEIFICGGAEIYHLFLPYVQKMYISQIQGKYQADTYFPEWNQALFNCVDENVLSENVTVYTYERKF